MARRAVSAAPLRVPRSPPVKQLSGPWLRLQRRRSSSLSVPRARHARRAPRARRLLPAMLAVGVLALVGTLQLARPLPLPITHTVLPRSSKVPGVPSPVPWPAQGQGAIAVPALGMVLASGTEQPVPVASLTKIMTAYVVLRDHPLALRTQGPAVTISASDQSEANAEADADDSSVPVQAGEVLSERQLLDGLLVQSANNLADVLARWDAGSVATFVSKMNASAASLGMSETHYVDADGIDRALGEHSCGPAPGGLRGDGDPVVRRCRGAADDHPAHRGDHDELCPPGRLRWRRRCEVRLHPGRDGVSGPCCSTSDRWPPGAGHGGGDRPTRRRSTRCRCTSHDAVDRRHGSVPSGGAGDARWRARGHYHHAMELDRRRGDSSRLAERGCVARRHGAPFDEMDPAESWCPGGNEVGDDGDHGRFGAPERARSKRGSDSRPVSRLAPRALLSRLAKRNDARAPRFGDERESPSTGPTSRGEATLAACEHAPRPRQRTSVLASTR